MPANDQKMKAVFGKTPFTVCAPAIRSRVSSVRVCQCTPLFCFFLKKNEGGVQSFSMYGANFLLGFMLFATTLFCLCVSGSLRADARRDAKITRCTKVQILTAVCLCTF